MELVALTVDEVTREARATLGLASDVPLDSPTGLAAAVRRAASVEAPLTRRRLTRMVADSLRGLVASHDGVRALVSESVEQLVGSGDLIEVAPLASDRTRREIVLGGPAFVDLGDEFVVLGVRPDAVPILPDALMPAIRITGHLRRLPATTGIDASHLEGLGLRRISVDQWLRAPRPMNVEQVVEELESRLGSAPITADCRLRHLLDTASPVTYYRGRWRPPAPDDAGIYIARREQQYGSDLWSAVVLSAGHVTHAIDFPLSGASVTPQTDDAWRVQAALDAHRGTPQLVGVRPGVKGGSACLDLYSPLPSWAQRRLDVVGHRVETGPQALFTYSVPSGRVEEELDCLHRSLWMGTSELGT